MCRIILVTIGVIILAAGALFAQDEPAVPETPPKEAPKAKTAAPALEHVIYVPYKELSKVFEKEGRGVFIKYEEFRKIWERATREKVRKPLPPVPGMVTKATYDLKVENKVARGTGVLTVEVLTEDWISLPLNLDKLALKEATLDGGRALLLAGRTGYTLVLRGKGEHKLEFSFAVPLEKTGGSGSFKFGCPAAPVSSLAVEIPETDIEVEVQPKLVATVKPGEKKTTILAFIGNTGTVGVSWKPKPREVLPLAGVFFASVVNMINAGDRVLSLKSGIDYEILQELNRLQVKLPAGLRLLGVDGENIKVWNVQEQEGEKILVVDLLSQARKKYSLKLTLDREIGAKEEELDLPVVQVVGATRETGLVSLSVGSELWAKLHESKGVSQVSVDEMPSSAGRRPLLAFRYLAHPFSVKVKIGEVKPVIKVENYTRFTITKKFLDLAAYLVIDIEKRPVFTLQAEVPQGYTVLDIPGSIVKDYRLKDQEKKRILEIDLVRPVEGRLELIVYMQKKRDDKGALELPYTSVAGAEKETGVFGIFRASELKVVTEEKSGLVPADSAAFAPANSRLKPEANTEFAMAFRFHKLPVSAKLKVEPRKTRIDAAVETLVSVREEIVKVHSTINYKVLYAPVRELKLTLPKAAGEEARVQGANTSSVSKETVDDLTTWTVQLQGNVLGDYQLTVEYDMKEKFDTSSLRELSVGELKLLDVFQETGFIGIKKTESLRVSAKVTEGLEKVDVQELPEALRKKLPYEAYKYVSHPYKLALSVQKQELGKVLDTIINLMHIETEISRDGDATFKCLWQVQSKNRQFISFKLPKGAKVMKLYVDGKERRRTITKGEQYLAVNLAEGGIASEKVTIEAVYKKKFYEAEDASIGLAGSFALAAPVPEEEIPTLRSTWTLYLPQGYKYTAFSGNLRRLFQRESTWIWGKASLFGTPSDGSSDVAIKEEIRAIRKLFVKDPKLIKFEFSGDSDEFNFVKHEGSGRLGFTYFEKNFFYAIDVLILIATIAGMLAAAAYVPYLTKTRLAVPVIAISLVLQTLLSGAGGEFFITIFLGAVFASAYWIVRFFALPPAKRLAAAQAPPPPKAIPGEGSEGGGSDA